MAPVRARPRARRARWLRLNYASGRAEVTIAGERSRKIYDSYCPYCATDIRSMGPRRLVRCPNTALCGKPLPIDDATCPNCTHYVRSTDNFCRICRTNLRSFVRGMGGIYQQLSRVPSPLRVSSPPRPQPPALEPSSDSDGDDDDDGAEGGFREGGGAGANGHGGAGPQNAGGFLRVVAIDD